MLKLTQLQLQAIYFFQQIFIISALKVTWEDPMTLHTAWFIVFLAVSFVSDGAAFIKALWEFGSQYSSEPISTVYRWTFCFKITESLQIDFLCDLALYSLSMELVSSISVYLSRLLSTPTKTMSGRAEVTRMSSGMVATGFLIAFILGRSTYRVILSSRCSLMDLTNILRALSCCQVYLPCCSASGQSWRECGGWWIVYGHRGVSGVDSQPPSSQIQREWEEGHLA